MSSNKDTLLVAVGVVLCGLLGFWSGLKYPTHASNSQLDKKVVQQAFVSSDEVLNSVQGWRQFVGKPTYRFDERLCYLASERAIQIQNDFSHDGFKDFYTNYRTSLSEFPKVAENLSEGWGKPNDILNAWLESPTHREILEKDYTHTCMRCLNNKCVQIFATLQP